MAAPRLSASSAMKPFTVSFSRRHIVPRLASRSALAWRHVAPSRLLGHHETEATEECSGCRRDDENSAMPCRKPGSRAGRLTRRRYLSETGMAAHRPECRALSDAPRGLAAALPPW